MAEVRWRVDRLADAERMSLDGARHAELQADHPLARRQAVIGDEGLLRSYAVSASRNGYARVNGSIGERRRSAARSKSEIYLRAGHAAEPPRKLDGARSRDGRTSSLGTGRRDAPRNRAVQRAGQDDVAAAQPAPAGPSLLASHATLRAGRPSAAAPAPLSTRGAVAGEQDAEQREVERRRPA